MAEMARRAVLARAARLRLAAIFADGDSVRENNLLFRAAALPWQEAHWVRCDEYGQLLLDKSAGQFRSVMRRDGIGDRVVEVQPVTRGALIPAGDAVQGCAAGRPGVAVAGGTIPGGKS